MIEVEEEKNDEKLFEGVGEYWVRKRISALRDFPQNP
jgi:hypothetical protein